MKCSQMQMNFTVYIILLLMGWQRKKILWILNLFTILFSLTKIKESSRQEFKQILKVASNIGFLLLILAGDYALINYVVYSLSAASYEYLITIIMSKEFFGLIYFHMNMNGKSQLKERALILLFKLPLENAVVFTTGGEEQFVVIAESHICNVRRVADTYHTL